MERLVKDTDEERIIDYEEVDRVECLNDTNLIDCDTLQQLKEYYRNLPTYYQAVVAGYLLGLQNGREQK